MEIEVGEVSLSSDGGVSGPSATIAAEGCTLSDKARELWDDMDDMDSTEYEEMMRLTKKLTPPLDVDADS